MRRMGALSLCCESRAGSVASVAKGQRDTGAKAHLDEHSTGLDADQAIQGGYAGGLVEGVNV